MIGAGDLKRLFDIIHAAMSDPPKPWALPLRSTDASRGTVVFVNGVGTHTDEPPLRALATAIQSDQLAPWEFTYASDGKSGYGPRATIVTSDLQRLATDLDGQIPADRKFALVGHSQGGLIVAAWLKHHLARGTLPAHLTGAAFVSVPWNVARMASLIWPDKVTWSDRATSGSSGVYEPYERYERVKLHIEGLITAIEQLGQPVDWLTPTTLVQLCKGEKDGILHSSAYAGQWVGSNVAIRIWPATTSTRAREVGVNTPGHMRVASEDSAFVRAWLGDLF